MDLDRFTERAAIMEYDGGLSRFDAETAAAKAQGYPRHAFTNAIRDFEQTRDHRATAAREPANDLSRMQPVSPQKTGLMPERHVPTGRGAVDVLALRMVGR